jgi:hypothetical protein
VIKLGAKVNTINHMIVVDAIVRKDEVVGSIPTSSTKLQALTNSAKPHLVQFCPQRFACTYE